jgi:hypothetical protein
MAELPKEELLVGLILISAPGVIGVKKQSSHKFHALNFGFQVLNYSIGIPLRFFKVILSTMISKIYNVALSPMHSCNPAFYEFEEDCRRISDYYFHGSIPAGWRWSFQEKK